MESTTPSVVVEDINNQNQLYETEIHVVYEGESVPASVQQRALFDLKFSSSFEVEEVHSLSDAVQLLSCESDEKKITLRSLFKTPPKPLYVKKCNHFPCNCS